MAEEGKKVDVEVEGSAKEEQKQVPLKKGDYQIHFYLEEGRSLLPKSEGDTVDPIVTISCFGKKKYTKKVDDVGGSAAVYWGEHFFFEA